MWIKCNIDGASKGNHGSSACDGIFRDNEANMLMCFAEPHGISSSYKAELCGIMLAIEIAHQNNWNQIWFETDSSLVVMAIKNSFVIPWNLRNRWSNSMIHLGSMNFIITHTYREGNQAADILANFALSLDQKMYWQDTPLFIREAFGKNKLCWSNYRFCD